MMSAADARADSLPRTLFFYFDEVRYPGENFLKGNDLKSPPLTLGALVEGYTAGARPRGLGGET
jgi:hypothetical protein